jgi:hypothetical protein
MRDAFARVVGIVVIGVVFAACGGGGGGGTKLSGSSLTPATAEVVATSPPASVVTGTPATVATPAALSATDATRVASVLAASQRADGSIPYTATVVNPYFANIAAIGALHAGATGTNVRAYIAWYVLRSRDPNPWGIAGAITDYTILANGTLQTTGEADSIDSYAATFLTLVATAWRNGDAPTRAYVQSLRSDVERIASAIDAVTDTDGLTWALPTYRFKYVMDQSEVYEGLNDLAIVRSEAYGDAAGALAAQQHAATIGAAITGTFWNAGRGTFAVAIDATGTPTR